MARQCFFQGRHLIPCWCSFGDDIFYPGFLSAGYLVGAAGARGGAESADWHQVRRPRRTASVCAGKGRAINSLSRMASSTSSSPAICSSSATKYSAHCRRVGAPSFSERISRRSIYYCGFGGVAFETCIAICHEPASLTAVTPACPLGPLGNMKSR